MRGEASPSRRRLLLSKHADCLSCKRFNCFVHIVNSRRVRIKCLTNAMKIDCEISSFSRHSTQTKVVVLKSQIKNIFNTVS